MGTGPRCRRPLIAGVLLLATAIGGYAARAADPEPGPDAADVYVRAPKDFATAVTFVAGEARRVEAAFDAATFDPPPGLTEFTLEHAFFEDLEPWIEAFAGWARTASYQRAWNEFPGAAHDRSRAGGGRG